MLGFLNPDELTDGISSHLLAEWIAYSQVEPFGDELLDAHFAQLESLIANQGRKRGSQIEPERFRLWKPDAEKWDPQAFFKGLKDAFDLNKE